MDAVRLPPAAEALFRAHQDRSTGWLTLVCRGREAKLYVQHGDLVGARLGFGHQTDAQALLAAGLLPLAALDGLWARGVLGDPAQLCEAAKTDPGQMAESRALASVRRVTALADEASFMPALVEVSFPRVRGARAVRAAFETLPPVPADARIRCTNLAAAEAFLGSPEERTFLALFEQFRLAPSLSPIESALLRVLEHGGWVEILDPSAWERRTGAEAVEAARRAEEASRREAARMALEAARSAEEQRQAEMRQRAEIAQRALEAARAAEDGWRRAQATPWEDEGLADTLRSRAPALSTEREFPIPEPPRPAPAAAPPPPVLADEPLSGLPPMPLLTSATPQPGPVRPEVTQRMGEPGGPVVPEDHPWVDQGEGSEDTLVRAGQGAEVHTDPYAQPLLREPRQTDPYAVALPRAASPLPPAGAEHPWLSGTPTPPEGTPETAEPVLEAEALILPEGDEPVLAPPPPEPASTLVEELSEALRRAGSEAPAEFWNTTGAEAVGSRPAEPAPSPLVEELSEALRRAGSEAPAELWNAPSTEAVGSRPTERAPLRLGPEAEGGDEADLWKLVGGTPSQAPASFEDALRQVDSQLESLAGLRREAPAKPAVPLPPAELDTLVRTSFSTGSWTLQPPSGPSAPTPPPALTPSGSFPLAALSQTPLPSEPPVLPDPPQLSAERRAALLRQARQGADTEPAARSPSSAPPRLPEEPPPPPEKAVPPAPPRDPVAAAEALAAGELALRKRDYAQAELQFMRSHTLDPRPSTLAARAWAIYTDPARKNEAGRARAMMGEAIKADPNCDRAHYQLGVIARVEGDVARAERHFREAVRANPRHLEAAQELRLLQMRRRPRR